MAAFEQRVNYGRKPYGSIWRKNEGGFNKKLMLMFQIVVKLLVRWSGIQEEQKGNGKQYRE
jgi:hypothetical protein